MSGYKPKRVESFAKGSLPGGSVQQGSWQARAPPGPHHKQYRMASEMRSASPYASSGSAYNAMLLLLVTAIASAMYGVRSRYAMALRS